MKRFLQFLSEAKESQAALRAKKLGLSGDGHGGWIDRSGRLVARTEKGTLKFLDRRQASGKDQEGGASQTRGVASPSPVSQQAPPPSASMAKSKSATDGETEGDEDTITIVFGRFNPPTIGHEKLLKTANRISAGGEIRVYPSRIQDPKKNPLDPDIKVSYMKKMFPDFEEAIINDYKMESIFDVLSSIYDEGYENVNLVVGSDRKAEFENLALKHNGDFYNFNEIKVFSAGAADKDSGGIEGVSASKMRRAVLDNNFNAFRRGTPKSLDDAETQSLFDAVRQGMGIKRSALRKENYELWEIAPKFDLKNLRENYIRGNIFTIGSKVQNLNTGLIGEVIRRGTNHLICVTEDGYMFKSWIKDLMEYTEVKMDKMFREPGKPNTLAGTTGYLKYAVQQTPGATLGSENLQKGGKAFLNFINKYRKKKADH